MDTFARMRQLTGTTAEWAANDLIIGLGELAVEIVSPGVHRMKMGDGSTNYSALPYYDPGVGSFVLKAGDTMTGNLTTPGFNVPDGGGTATVPTVAYTDASRKVATTAFVKNLLATRGQGDAIYEYAGATLATPAAGKVIIDPGTNPVRQIALNATDADGVGRFLTLLQPGDSLIITNEFTPVTYYARYDLVSTVTDHTSWVEFTAHLITFSGIAEAPPLGTRLKLTGYLNLATGDGPILGVTAGTGLTGGGSVGVVTLALDPAAVVAPSIVDAAGDLIMGTAADTVARLAKGTAGQVLGSTASGIAWGNAGVSVYSETVVTTPIGTMDVTIPAGAKAIELLFWTSNTATTNGLLELVPMVGGTPNITAIHNYYAVYTVGGAAPGGAGTNAGTSIVVASACSQSFGSLKLGLIPGNRWSWTGSYYAYVSGHLHQTLSGVFTLAGVTGFRLRNSGSTPTFIAGSYLRCLAIV